MLHLPILITLSLLAATPTSADLSLMPRPQHVQRHAGVLNLSAPFAISVQAPIDADSGAEISDDRVSQAVARLRQMLAEHTHHAVCISPCPKAVRLTVVWDDALGPVQNLHDSEAYTLDITTSQAVLHAQTALGVLRGLETLDQWITEKDGVTLLDAVHISDRPRFVWRGLLVDSARHFMPTATIKRNLDAMAAVKLNVLHWHLSDDQGFRVESHIFPELTAQGSCGEYYTQTEVEDIVAYARRLGIRVVPEFDMPGHTASWFISHPELASDAGPHAPMSHWGILDSALNPARESTYVFIDMLLGEMTALFPDAYLHLGGDEVSGVAWRNNPEIMAFMQAHDMADAHALQTYFINRVAHLAAAHGKKVVGWDEILQPGLAPDTVVQSWRGPDGMRQSLDAGYQSILSHGWYLGDSAAAHYRNDPADGLSAQAAQSPALLGGEACQWSELVTPDLVDASIWPRTAAVAERLWSAQSVRDVADMYRRLAVQSARLEALGLNHRSYQERRFVALANSPHVVPLQQLASVLESRRENWWPDFRSKRALDGFCDVLYAESDRGRALQSAAEALMAHPDAHEAADVLTHEFDALVQNRAAVDSLLRASPALHAILPISELVAQMSRIGLDAIAALQTKRTLSAAWGAQARRILGQAQNEQLGLYVALAPAVGALVEATSPGAPTAAPMRVEAALAPHG